MRYITFDVETIPAPRFVDPDAYAEDPLRWDEAWVEAYSRDHGPAAISEAIAAGQAKVRATGCVPALHATTCQVVQASFGYRQDGEIKTKLCQFDDYHDEAALLSDALHTIASAQAKGTRLVSFNGKGFDVPVLRARAAICRLPRSGINWRRLLYPYSDDHHADLRLILSADDRRAHGTLEWWATAFGVHAESHGGDVFGWVQAGEWEKLRQYGEVEARTLVELFEACEAIL
jgi:hypothetical protein